MLKGPLLLLILSLPLVFVGCVSVEERMQGYLGQHYSKVVAIWGAPEIEVNDGEGGKLMTWRFETTYTTPATVRTTTNHDNDTYAHGNSHTHGNGHGHSHDYHGGHQAIPHHGSTYQSNTHGNQVTTTVYTPESTTTNTYTRSFYTDADGYIYDYAWQGWHPGY